MASTTPDSPSHNSSGCRQAPIAVGAGMPAAEPATTAVTRRRWSRPRFQPVAYEELTRD